MVREGEEEELTRDKIYAKIIETAKKYLAKLGQGLPRERISVVEQRSTGSSEEGEGCI